MSKNDHENASNATEKLLDALFSNGEKEKTLVWPIATGRHVKIAKYKQKKRWYLDTDLHTDFSCVNYSDKGKDILREIATTGQLSDEVRIENGPGPCVFTISFSNDTENGARWTYGVWLETLKTIIQDDTAVQTIKL